MPSSSFPGTHIKVETGERSNHLSVRDLVPARCFYKSMHLIPQLDKKKVFEITPMSLSVLICNHFKITILIPPFSTHFERLWNSTLWESMPVHENPANRHARTTRISHSRWAISGTHPANRREFGDPFCSVLFCSVLFTHWAATHGQPAFQKHMQSRLTRTAPI